MSELRLYEVSYRNRFGEICQERVQAGSALAAAVATKRSHRWRCDGFNASGEVVIVSVKEVMEPEPAGDRVAVGV